MKLYLVRHGKARKGGKDRLRPLTLGGIAEIEAVAALLKRLRLRMEAIWHSDRVRAVETAQILLGAVVMTGRMSRHADMGPDDSIRPVLRKIKKTRGDLMIVGHLPHLSKLASKLLTGSASREIVKFSTGSVAALTREIDGGWCLEWLSAPMLAKRLTRTTKKSSAAEKSTGGEAARTTEPEQIPPPIASQQ